MQRPPFISRWKALSLALALAGGALPSLQAQSLVDLYESARSFDAAYQSARSLFEANQTKAEQARAGLLPVAGVAASVQRSQIKIFPDAGGAAAIARPRAMPMTRTAFPGPS